MAAPLTSGGNSRRIIATLGVLGAIGALATVGTYSLFTDSVTAGPQTVSSGTVDIALGSANRLTVGASGVAPGDSIQRAVDIVNNGSLDFASASLTTLAALPATALTTDTTNGLQMAVDKCSVPWTETPVGAGYTYACSGTISAVLASAPVIQSAVPLTGLAALTSGGTDHLRVTLSLPTGAGNTFQNLSSTISYQFDATQRAGTAK